MYLESDPSTASALNLQKYSESAASSSGYMPHYTGFLEAQAIDLSYLAKFVANHAFPV
jgi:hypothetical protein